MAGGKPITPTQLEAALRELDDPKAWMRELRRLWRRIGTAGVQWSRSEMRAGDRQLAAAARALRSKPTTVGAQIAVSRTARAPQALAAVYGTKGPTGWLANDRHKGTTARNNPRWIGDSWEVANPNEGPRGINPALARHQGDLLEMTAEEVMAITARALPRGALV
jgi:hypothetical protein